jgi:hypothetical protein
VSFSEQYLDGFVLVRLVKKEATYLFELGKRKEEILERGIG